MHAKTTCIVVRRALIGAVVVGIALSACSGDDKQPATQSQSDSATSSTTTAPVPDRPPASGTVVLSVGSEVETLDIQQCVQTAAGGVNLTAAGAGDTGPTLVVNVANPASATTLVYTTRSNDNSFTTHSMSSSPSTRASVDQLRVRVSGTAVKQDYSPNGTAQGQSTSENLTVEGQCTEIRPPNPPPQFGSTN
jgi:hypothetical protein